MRTGSTLELQIQGARTGATSKDEPTRSLGGSGGRRSSGVQLGHDRSGAHQPISPYLSSLTYGSHELLGSRRSAAGSSGARGLAAGASAAVQEAHQRLERLLGPQQQQGTGTSGSIKRPTSAPLTFGAPIGTTSSGSGSGGGASSSTAVSGSSGSHATTSRQRPASASPLHTSAKGFSSAGLTGGASAGASVSLLSTAPAAMCHVSSSSAASNHRVGSRRGHSAAEPSSGMLATVGVTGVISSGHNVPGTSAADGNNGGAKARLKSPTGGGSTVAAKEALSETVVVSSADVLLDGSASMPTLLPSSLGSAPGSGRGGGGGAVAATASGRGRSPSAALTTSSSEKVLGTSRLSITTGRSAGQSALRSATPSSNSSPKTSIATGSGFGSGSHGSSGLGTTGASKSRLQTRRRVSGGDPSGNSGTGVSSSGTDGAGGGRAAMSAAGATTGAITTLKVGHVVDTGRTGSGGSSGSAGGGAGSRSVGPEGRTHRSGGSSPGGPGESSKVRMTAAGGDRQHPLGPRSPSSPSGPVVGSAVAGKAVGGRSSSRGAVGVSGSGAKTATPGSSSIGGTKVAASGRRSSSGQHELLGATAVTPGGLAGEFVLTGTAGTRVSGAPTGVGGSTSSSSSSLHNGSAAGRPSSSERSRRRSSSNNATATVTTGRPGGMETGATTTGGSGGQVLGPGTQRDAAVRQTTPSSMSSTGAALVSAASGTSSPHASTGHRVKPPSIDLSALTSLSASSEATPGAGKYVAYGATEPARASAAAAAVPGGRRASSGDFPGLAETRVAPPLSPTPAGSPRGTSRFQVPGYLDEQAAPPPLLLLPTRSPLQSPRSVLGLPRRTRGGLGSGSGGMLWASGGGRQAASRWARSPPLPLPSDDSAALSAVCSGVMPPSAVVMHDLQAAAHGLMLQVGAGTSSFIETLCERYVEVYRSGRKAQ